MSKKNVKKGEAKEGSGNRAQAILRHARISPRKVRHVLDLVRGKQIEPALQILEFTPKKGARMVAKLLKSAVANARDTKGLDADELWVTRAWANEGPIMKRYMPRARGSADKIRKRSAHITIEVGLKV